MSKPPNAIWAIVPAAGIGQRMGTVLPKQYLPILNKPILAHTLDVICQIPYLQQVIVPLHPQDNYWSSLVHLPYQNYVTVKGGELRHESVLNALNYLNTRASADDWVLVHDASRPCVTVAGICELITQIADHPVGGLWGVPVRDTLKQVNEARDVIQTIPREQLWHAQTPQIFRFELLYKAMIQANHDKMAITDEASSIEHLGYHPLMVQGSYANIKITWPEDLITAEHWLKQHEVFDESRTRV
jgi:2-C-methyl-D-erythritol 4-phosphate cytidylyltransferase